MNIRKWLTKGLYYLFSLTVGVFLALFISDRGKRLIAASSLYAHMDNFQANKLDDINLLFYVDTIDNFLHISCESTRSMMFPVFIQQYIWGRLDKRQITSFSTRESAILYAREKMPWFIQYDPAIFTRDIISILKRHNAKFLRLEHEHQMEKLAPPT